MCFIFAAEVSPSGHSSKRSKRNQYVCTVHIILNPSRRRGTFRGDHKICKCGRDAKNADAAVLSSSHTYNKGNKALALLKKQVYMYYLLQVVHTLRFSFCFRKKSKTIYVLLHRQSLHLSSTHNKL